MMTELSALVAKEIRQTVRDKKMLGLMVFAPVIQLTILGFAVDLEVKHVPAVVADEDHTMASRDLAQGLVAGDTFDDRGQLVDGQEAAATVLAGQASIAMVIHPGLERAISRARPASVQILVDGADSIQGVIAQNVAAAYMTQRSLALMTERLRAQAEATGFAPTLSPVRMTFRNFYNQNLDSTIFFVPGVAAILLLVVTTVVTAMGVSREDEAGTLEQVLVTPLTPTMLVLGKTIPYALIGLMDIGLVLTAGAVVFDVPVRGELWVVFLAGFLYMLTTLGLGLLAGTLARSQQQAFFNVAFFLLPAMIISGFIAPVSAMPHWLQTISAFDPVRHFVEILRAVLLKGAGVNDLAHSFVALAGMGISTFALAAWALRRKLR